MAATLGQALARAMCQHFDILVGDGVPVSRSSWQLYVCMRAEHCDPAFAASTAARWLTGTQDPRPGWAATLCDHLNISVRYDPGTGWSAESVKPKGG